MTKNSRTEKNDMFLIYTHAAFRPYALALGQLALAWNGLHEALALLFCSVMGGGITNQFLAIWHAINVDRAQRGILLAAAKSNFRTPRPEKFLEDIEWICKQADALEDKRNDALHSPLWGSKRGASNTLVIPMAGLGHVRAMKLSDKDILKEFRWCRDSSIALHRFAAKIDVALCNHMQPWPDRPRLPNRGATNAQTRHRQVPQAKLARQRRSSPA